MGQTGLTVIHKSSSSQFPPRRRLASDDGVRFHSTFAAAHDATPAPASGSDFRPSLPATASGVAATDVGVVKAEVGEGPIFSKWNCFSRATKRDLAELQTKVFLLII